MTGSTRTAMAIGLAAFHQALNEGGVNKAGRKSERAREMDPALAQGQGGSPFEQA